MPVVIAGLILSFLVMLLFGGTELDRGLLMLFSTGDTPRLEQAADLITAAALPVPLLAMALTGGGYLLVRGQWRAGLLLLAVTLLGRLLVDAIQALTEGARPAVDERLFPRQGGGYPSGQAASATITSFALAYLLTRHYPARALALGLAATGALLAGAARLVQGAAWPSDVIGGWAFGLAWVLLVLRLAGEDLGDGTARPLRHSVPQGERAMENRRTETARQNDDSDLIENLEEAPSFGSASGGQLQRDIGSRAELEREDVGEAGVTRVRDSDKNDGDANLPRFNQK
jgi:undecaprenyl-diphosphatase